MKVRIVGEKLLVDGEYLQVPATDQFQQALAAALEEVKAELRIAPGGDAEPRIWLAYLGADLADVLTAPGSTRLRGANLRFSSIELGDLLPEAAACWDAVLGAGFTPGLAHSSFGVPAANGVTNLCGIHITASSAT